MRVLFTLNSSNYGGMERTVLDLVSGLESHEKFVVCPKGDLYEEFKKFSKVIEHKKISKKDFSYFRFLVKTIKENKIDIIHANEPLMVFYGMLAGFWAGCKIRISHTHTPISMWRVSLLNKILNIVLNSLVVNLFSTYEIALTNSIKKQKIKELIFPFKLKVIPNCISDVFLKKIDGYKTPNPLVKKLNISGKFVFLYLSRFTKEKNQLLLIESFNDFIKTYKDAVLILAGKGEDFSKIKKRISALNLEKSVLLLDDVSEIAKIDLYMLANCFVFPSLAEGFGITLLEAMYSCYPVICSNLEVLREVSGNKVMFFKNNNQKSLTSKLKEAFNQKNNYSKLEENKKFVIKNYSFENYIKNYERLYSIK